MNLQNDKNLAKYITAHYTSTALFLQPFQFKLELKMNNPPLKKKKRVGSNKQGGRIFFQILING